MAQQNINIGRYVGDPASDATRLAWTKAQANFTELYAGVGSQQNAAGLDANGNLLPVGGNAITLHGVTLREAQSVNQLVDRSLLSLGLAYGSTRLLTDYQNGVANVPAGVFLSTAHAQAAGFLGTPTISPATVINAAMADVVGKSALLIDPQDLFIDGPINFPNADGLNIVCPYGQARWRGKFNTTGAFGSAANSAMFGNLVVADNARPRGLRMRGIIFEKYYSYAQDYITGQIVPPYAYRDKFAVHMGDATGMNAPFSLAPDPAHPFQNGDALMTLTAAQFSAFAAALAGLGITVTGSTSFAAGTGPAIVSRRYVQWGTTVASITTPSVTGNGGSDLNFNAGHTIQQTYVMPPTSSATRATPAGNVIYLDAMPAGLDALHFNDVLVDASIPGVVAGSIYRGIGPDLNTPGAYVLNVEAPAGTLNNIALPSGMPVNTIVLPYPVMQVFSGTQSAYTVGSTPRNHPYGWLGAILHLVADHVDVTECEFNACSGSNAGVLVGNNMVLTDCGTCVSSGTNGRVGDAAGGSGGIRPQGGSGITIIRLYGNSGDDICPLGPNNTTLAPGKGGGFSQAQAMSLDGVWWIDPRDPISFQGRAFAVFDTLANPQQGAQLLTDPTVQITAGTDTLTFASGVAVSSKWVVGEVVNNPSGILAPNSVIQSIAGQVVTFQATVGHSIVATRPLGTSAPVTAIINGGPGLGALNSTIRNCGVRGGRSYSLGSAWGYVRDDDSQNPTQFAFLDHEANTSYMIAQGGSSLNVGLVIEGLYAGCHVHLRNFKMRGSFGTAITTKGGNIVRIEAVLLDAPRATGQGFNVILNGLLPGSFVNNLTLGSTPDGQAVQIGSSNVQADSLGESFANANATLSVRGLKITGLPNGQTAVAIDYYAGTLSVEDVDISTASGAGTSNGCSAFSVGPNGTGVLYLDDAKGSIDGPVFSAMNAPAGACYTGSRWVFPAGQLPPPLPTPAMQAVIASAVSAALAAVSTTAPAS